ncbi:MAG: C40 family peptidase [Undibacterium sp.]
MGYFSKEVIEAAKAHARAEFPKESCGLVVSNKYVRCKNVAEDPLNDFQIETSISSKAQMSGKLRGVFHSHPNGPYYPSMTDMKTQISMDIPWAIITLDEERISDPIMWGDQLGIEPLVGREFMHGVTDCYSIIRDAFRMGREEMKKQEMSEWPFPPIVLPEVARDDSWWKSDDDLYSTHFEKFGFKIVDLTDAKPGDVWLKSLGTRQTNPDGKLNHGGVLVSGDQILHHLPARTSGRAPSGLWMRSADLIIRYFGEVDA